MLLRTLGPLLCVALTAGSIGPAEAATGSPVLVGAGDIGVCASSADEATAALLAKMAGTVFTAGDNAYPDGAADDFVDCYGPSWGAFVGRTRPSPGNHDYHTPGASGHFDYFGWRAGPGNRGYYAYTRGSWRIYSLNSEHINPAQIEWLKADLAAHPSLCSLAYWHRPRFSSGAHGNYEPAKVLWRPLFAAGVELVVSGHDHDYERFAPQRPGGNRSRYGIRQFVVGTGGADLRTFSEIQPNSLARQARVHGVLRLELGDGTYKWKFVSVDGTYTDSGSARCHRPR